MFVLSFKNGNDDTTRDSFDKYYMLLVEIREFNAFVDTKQFFDKSIKNKQEAYKKLIKMPKTDDYKT